MKNKFRILYMVVIDTILINVSLMLAIFLKYEGCYNNIPAVIFQKAVLIAFTVTLVKLAGCYLFRLYSSIWQYASSFEALLIFSSILSENLIILALCYLCSLRLDTSLIAINILSDLLFIGGNRFGYRVLKHIFKSSLLFAKDSKRVLIVGNGEAGVAVVKELKLHPGLNSVPVAILDDDPNKKGRKINGVPIVGQTRDILKAVVKNNIDEIIIVMPANQKPVREIYELCSKSMCRVKILPSYSQLIDEKVVIQRIRDVRLEDLLGREPVNLDIQGICEFFAGKTILVTGGGGSIGSELCRQVACCKPRRLIILDNYENGVFDIQTELKASFPELDLVTVMANIREKDKIFTVFKQYMPDLIYHAAAYKHVPLMEENPGEAVKNNVLGTLNVAECSYECKVNKFVLISTDKAVNPKSVMGATKKISEMIIQAMGRLSSTEFVAVRFGNVLGSNGSVVPLFKKQIEAGGPVTVTHPDVTRFFMTIPEAVQLVVEASIIAKGGEIFVLDMGKPVRIYDLARNLIRLSGFEPGEDIKIEFTGLRDGEKLNEELFLGDEELKSTAVDKIFVIQSAFCDLGSLYTQIDHLKDVDLNNPDEAIAFIKSLIPAFRKT